MSTSNSLQRGECPRRRQSRRSSLPGMGNLRWKRGGILGISVFSLRISGINSWHNFEFWFLVESLGFLRIDEVLLLHVVTSATKFWFRPSLRTGIEMQIFVDRTNPQVNQCSKPILRDLWYLLSAKWRIGSMPKSPPFADEHAPMSSLDVKRLKFVVQVTCRYQHGQMGTEPAQNQPITNSNWEPTSKWLVHYYKLLIRDDKWGYPYSKKDPCKIKKQNLTGQQE